MLILGMLNFSALAEDTPALVFGLMGAKKWEEAKEKARESGDKALLNVVLQQKFLDVSCKTNDFESVIRFVKAHPNWPFQEKLREYAEKYLGKNSDKKFILAWFEKNKPKTGIGYKYYALAASSLINDKLKLIPIIKEGWIYGDFTLDEERQYYAKFKNILTKEDHIRRIEEHLWIKDIEEARRSFYLVDNEHRQAFEVAILAIDKSSRTDAAFAKLHTRHYIPVVLYHYLEYKKKTPPNEYMVSLFNKLPIDRGHEDQWAKLQLYYAREFIDLQDFDRSYRVLYGHFAVDEECVREAEWLLGWLSLRKMNDPDQALKHFKNFSKVAHRPISVAKGQYWLARTYEKMKQNDRAVKYYQAAARYSCTFYGQLASVELKEHRISLPPKPKIDTSHREAIEKHELVRATKLLIRFGKPELAEVYAKSVMDIVASPGEIALLSEMIKEQGHTYYTVGFAKLASQKHVLIKDAAYPTPYNFKNIPIEAPLAYGVIRQESVFNQYAVSGKNAMGLMQLIKGTACSTAKITRDRCDIPRLTRDPQYNIRLGTAYLSELIKERGGSYILAIASYNTNGKNVDKWIKRFGDPREMQDIRKIIDWLELIPFSETRNYVQRVLEGTQVYRHILNKDTKLKLVQDLLRGSGKQKYYSQR